jgi:hypothetical protein
VPTPTLIHCSTLLRHPTPLPYSPPRFLFTLALGTWVTPGEAAICHSPEIRRLLAVPAPTTAASARDDLIASAAKPSAKPSALLGGLQLVHPDATALHTSSALRTWLGVKQFSPLQLVGLARVSMHLVFPFPSLTHNTHSRSRSHSLPSSSLPHILTHKKKPLLPHRTGRSSAPRASSRRSASPGWLSCFSASSERSCQRGAPPPLTEEVVGVQARRGTPWGVEAAGR